MSQSLVITDLQGELVNPEETQEGGPTRSSQDEKELREGMGAGWGRDVSKGKKNQKKKLATYLMLINSTEILPPCQRLGSKYQVDQKVHSVFTTLQKNTNELFGQLNSNAYSKPKHLKKMQQWLTPVGREKGIQERRCKKSWFITCLSCEYLHRHKNVNPKCYYIWKY